MLCDDNSTKLNSFQKIETLINKMILVHLDKNDILNFLLIDRYICGVVNNKYRPLHKLWKTILCETVPLYATDVEVTICFSAPTTHPAHPQNVVRKLTNLSPFRLVYVVTPIEELSKHNMNYQEELENHINIMRTKENNCANIFRTMFISRPITEYVNTVPINIIKSRWNELNKLNHALLSEEQKREDMDKYCRQKWKKQKENHSENQFAKSNTNDIASIHWSFENFNWLIISPSIIHFEIHNNNFIVNSEMFTNRSLALESLHNHNKTLYNTNNIQSTSHNLNLASDHLMEHQMRCVTDTHLFNIPKFFDYMTHNVPFQLYEYHLSKYVRFREMTMCISGFICFGKREYSNTSRFSRLIFVNCFGSINKSTVRPGINALKIIFPENNTQNGTTYVEHTVECMLYISREAKNQVDNEIDSPDCFTQPNMKILKNRVVPGHDKHIFLLQQQYQIISIEIILLTHSPTSMSIEIDDTTATFRDNQIIQEMTYLPIINTSCDFLENDNESRLLISNAIDKSRETITYICIEKESSWEDDRNILLPSTIWNYLIYCKKLESLCLDDFIVHSINSFSQIEQKEDERKQQYNNVNINLYNVLILVPNQDCLSFSRNNYINFGSNISQRFRKMKHITNRGFIETGKKVSNALHNFRNSMKQKVSHITKNSGKGTTGLKRREIDDGQNGDAIDIKISDHRVIHPIGMTIPQEIFDKTLLTTMSRNCSGFNATFIDLIIINERFYELNKFNNDIDRFINKETPVDCYCNDMYSIFPQEFNTERTELCTHILNLNSLNLSAPTAMITDFVMDVRKNNCLKHIRIILLPTLSSINMIYPIEQRTNSFPKIQKHGTTYPFAKYHFDSNYVSTQQMCSMKKCFNKRTQEILLQVPNEFDSIRLLINDLLSSINSNRNRRVGLSLIQLIQQ